MASSSGFPSNTGVDAVAGEVVAFEGEDDVEPVDVPADRLHAPFAPRPHFRGDVIEGADAVLLGEARHLHVEARVVDEDQHVGGVAQHIFAALAQLPRDGSQVAQYAHDAEERRFAVVARPILRSADVGHAVAAPETEAAPAGSAFEQSLRMRFDAVQVARRFAGDEVVLHGMSVFIVQQVGAQPSGALPRLFVLPRRRSRRSCPTAARRGRASRGIRPAACRRAAPAGCPGSSP